MHLLSVEYCPKGNFIYPKSVFVPFLSPPKYTGTETKEMTLLIIKLHDLLVSFDIFFMTVSPAELVFF